MYVSHLGREAEMQFSGPYSGPKESESRQVGEGSQVTIPSGSAGRSSGTPLFSPVRREAASWPGPPARQGQEEAWGQLKEMPSLLMWRGVVARPRLIGRQLLDLRGLGL